MLCRFLQAYLSGVTEKPQDTTVQSKGGIVRCYSLKLVVMVTAKVKMGLEDLTEGGGGGDTEGYLAFNKQTATMAGGSGKESVFWLGIL